MAAVGAGAAVLLAASITAAVTLRATDDPGETSGKRFLLYSLDCTDRTTTPEGTDLLKVSLDENTTQRVRVTGTFDGEVPDSDVTEGADDYTLSIEFFLLPEAADDDNAYSFFVHSMFGPYSVEARRVEGGSIDPGGVDLTVDGDRIELSIEPTAFIDLAPGTPMRVGARTLVTYFAADGSNSETVGQEDCPTEDRSTPQVAPSKSPSPTGAAEPQLASDGCVENCTFTVDDVQRDLSDILCKSQDSFADLNDDITDRPVNDDVHADKVVVCSSGGSADLSSYGIVFLWENSGSIDEKSVREPICRLRGAAVFGSSPRNPAYAVAGIKSSSAVIDALEEGGATTLCD